ncbi:MAG: glutathione S-transferase N-terminal domain-containing protein [Magnetovibrio sp.]|nr:glutathione S-transferase N-terminal domain-containing protein [Magnetovibrio sp.]
MIELYGHPTQNVLKVQILLEELNLPYSFINDRTLEAASLEFAAFRRASPTGQVPGLIDPQTGVELFESAAIMIYLAEKMGRFLPGLDQPAQRAETHKWLLFEAASVTPAMLDIYHYTLIADSSQPYCEERARINTRRALDVLESCLSQGRDHLAGAYSIADMILYPWMAILEDFTDIALGDYPHLESWTTRIANRAAVKKAETF